VRVFVILDDRTSVEHPLGDAVDVLLSREDAERFIGASQAKPLVGSAVKTSSRVFGSSQGWHTQPALRRSRRTISATGASRSCTLPGMPWARIGELVGHGDLVTTARTHTHVVADEAELDYAKLAGMATTLGA
jgi:hypothetical protein